MSKRPDVHSTQSDNLKVPIAPYKVASNPFTLREGNYLYLHGKKYRCPVINREQLETLVADIKRNLE